MSYTTLIPFVFCVILFRLWSRFIYGWFYLLLSHEAQLYLMEPLIISSHPCSHVYTTYALSPAWIFCFFLFVSLYSVLSCELVTCFSSFQKFPNTPHLSVGVSLWVWWGVGLSYTVIVWKHTHTHTSCLHSLLFIIPSQHEGDQLPQLQEDERERAAKEKEWQEKER